MIVKNRVPINDFMALAIRDAAKTAIVAIGGRGDFLRYFKSFNWAHGFLLGTKIVTSSPNTAMAIHPRNKALAIHRAKWIMFDSNSVRIPCCGQWLERTALHRTFVSEI